MITKNGFYSLPATEEFSFAVEIEEILQELAATATTGKGEL